MTPANKGKKKTSFFEEKAHVLRSLWRAERYTTLLVSVFVYIILSVMLPEKRWGHIILDAIFFILVFSVGHIISLLWESSAISKSILASSSILFIAAAIHKISKRVFNSKIVTGDTIRGAIIIYLFIGSLFSSIYILIEIISPGSFLITNSAGKPGVVSLEEISRLFGYFSFITLTTLGYGDIVPVKDLSRIMAWIEAFTGQIYLAVIIAHLVGMYIAQSMKKSS